MSDTKLLTPRGRIEAALSIITKNRQFESWAGPTGGGICRVHPDDLRAVLAELTDVHARLRFVIDSWPVPLEDGGITFPDGDFWVQTPDAKVPT